MNENVQAAVLSPGAVERDSEKKQRERVASACICS